MTVAATFKLRNSITRLLLASTSVLTLLMVQAASAQDVFINGGQTVTVPSGAYPSPWAIPDDLFVADAGSGMLIIENGADVTVGGYIAVGVNYINASGTITVTGAGSSLAGSSYVRLGHLGTGSLTISDGGLVTAPVVYMGSYANDTSSGS